MPIHQNQDGTWQWGKSGKKYKKKEDAIKQMKAIFANGYVEKRASYSNTLKLIKRAAQQSQYYTVPDGMLLSRNWRNISNITGDTTYKAVLNRLSTHNKGFDPNKIKAGQRLNLGTPVKSAEQVKSNSTKRKAPSTNWTAKQNAGAALSAWFKSRLNPSLLPVDTGVLKPYDTSSTGYLKNGQIALHNALARKQSSGNRYAFRGKAAGAWQMFPAAINDLKKAGELPQDFSLEDIYKNTDLANSLGMKYYNLINKNESDPAVGYMKYLLGRNSYENRVKRPGFLKRYPSKRSYALNYKGQYHPKNQQDDYGKMVRNFRRILAEQLEKAGKASKIPTAR